ncbi:hypothetical protein ARMGADRAFT_946857, partial [Armillaria gallica]
IVQTVYSKSAGKGSNHAWIPSTENIGTVSYLVVQLYEHLSRRTFQRVHRQFALMGLSRMAHLPSNSFVTAVPAESVKMAGDQVNITSQTMDIFEDLVAEKKEILKGVVNLNTVRRKGQENLSLLAIEETDGVEH